jgi:hypothetical protein
MQHDNDVARAEYHRVLSLGAEIDDFASRLNSLNGLVRVERDEGNRDAACGYYRQLMELAASHPAFVNNPAVEVWRQEFVDLACE